MRDPENSSAGEKRRERKKKAERDIRETRCTKVLRDICSCLLTPISALASLISTIFAAFSLSHPLSTGGLTNALSLSLSG